MADTSSLTSNETLKSIFGDGMSFELPKELKPDAVIASSKKEAEAIKSYRAKESEVEKAQAAGAARSASELAAKYEPQFQRTPDFAPSEDNKAALVGLFGLLGAIGAMGGGKSYGSALGAMNAMGGMLKGYQQGRKDLFEREKVEYDKAVQAVKLHNDEITKAYARAQAVAKTNLAKADAELKSTLRSLGAEMEASKVEREGISKAYESHIKAMNAGANAYKQYAAVIERLEKASGAGAKRSFVNVDNEQKYLTDAEIVQAQNEGKKISQVSKTAAGAPGGAIQFRYNQAVANASYQAAIEVQNYASLPLKSAPPEANAVLTDPAKGVGDAAIRYFAQSSTSAENRAVQQATAGLNRAVATIAASGRPGGVTEAAIKEFSKMAPTAGDKKINTFLYLAMMRQEFDVAYKDLVAAGADPKQIALAEEAKAMAYEAIPFTVQDVTRILRSGGPSLVNEKTKQLLTTSDRLKGFETSIAKVIRSGGGDVAPAAPAAPAAPTAAAEESENKKKARAAIAAGAPRDVVIKRLQDAGEDVSGL